MVNMLPYTVISNLILIQYIYNHGNVDVVQLPIAYDNKRVAVVVADTTSNNYVTISDAYVFSLTHLGVHRTAEIGWEGITIGF